MSKTNSALLSGIGRNGKRVYSATPASVRHVNRSIVLNLVRLHQSVSRARLSEMTGIYRSSVSEIVDELISEGLLVERLSSPSGRGRVPFQLSLNPKGFSVLGISIRPFQTFVATSGLNGSVERSVSFRTPRQPAILLRELARAVDQLGGSELRQAEGGIRQIGIGVPGLVEANEGVIAMVPSLPEYAQFPIAAEVEKLFGVPALADNDCNVGALAELWLNAREVAELRDFVFLEIGDVGVGSGIILNGALYHGSDCTCVGEFGHMVIDPKGPECRCGRRGCWERYVADEATWRRYDPQARFDPARFEKLITLARDERDARALKVFRQTAEYLSLGISNIVCSLNPQMVVVAGEITKLWTLLEGVVQTRWATTNLKVRIQVRPAIMDLDRLCTIGALALALSKTFGAPRLG